MTTSSATLPLVSAFLVGLFFGLLGGVARAPLGLPVAPGAAEPGRWRTRPLARILAESFRLGVCSSSAEL